MKWLCIPGWATGTDIFEDIIPDEASCDVVELNFFNNDDFPENITDGYQGIICYSLGSLLALGVSNIKKIIFIGGFSFFPGVEAREAKMRKMKINLMIRGLKKNPEKTLEDFYTEAGLEVNVRKNLNVNNLIHGLELLRDCDMSHALCNTDAEIFTIHGKDDVIVPEELNRMQFTTIVKERFLIDGNHGIIQSQSPQIKKLLSEII